MIGLSCLGKSTLLRCINRLVDPNEGQILWDGEDITAASPDEMRRIRRKIGMVFQHFNLVRRSKVITNVLAERLVVHPRFQGPHVRSRRVRTVALELRHRFSLLPLTSVVLGFWFLEF